MPTSSMSGQVRAWASTKWERADGQVFYQSPSQPYNESDKARVLWEHLRCRYCILNKHNEIPDQYRTGLPIPENLAIANIKLLSKVLLKEVKTWLKERF